MISTTVTGVNMKQIELTKGLFTIVDDDDFEHLSQFKWCAQRGRKNDHYAARRTKGKYIYMHKIIMHCPVGLKVDHKNHNTLDNQKSNLRICTNAQNIANKTPVGRSKYLGVSTNGFSWQATIRPNGKGIYLGSFKTEEEAAMAYDAAARVYFGDFANINIKC